MNCNESDSVLVIHPGGLGDVLLSLQAIASLRNRHPTDQIVLLAGSDVGSLLQACGVVDRTLTTESDDLASLMSGSEQLSSALRELLRRCKRVVGWLKDHDGSVRATLQRLGIPWIVLETPVPQRGVHQSKRFLDVLTEERCGHAQSAHLVIPETLSQDGAAVLRTMGIQKGQDFVVCHPGSGSVHKCVRPETMVEVIRKFRQNGVMPILVGGPADELAVERVRDLGVRDVPVIQRQCLPTIAGILAQARLFVGHDSGLTHLAGALQIPTVAIFGPTDSRQWAPQGDHVSVVTGPPCSCQGWACVRACEAKPCLSIAVEDILAASISLLSRYRMVTKS